MVLRYVFLGILLIIFKPVSSQETTLLDSIIYEFDKVNDSSKANIYLDISINNSFLDHNQTIEFHKHVYDYAIRTNNTAVIIKSLIRLGESYYRNGDFENSLNFTFQALDIVLDEKDTSNFFDCYEQLGSNYIAMDQHNSALSYFQESEKYLDKSEDPRNEISLLANMASIYTITGNSILAQKKYKRSLELTKELNFNLPKGSLLISLANLYRDYSTWPDSAMLYYNKALDFYSSNNRKSGQLNTIINLSQLYLKLNKIDLAKKYLNESLLIAEELGDINKERDACKLLSDLYSTIQNFNLAYQYHKRYSILSDSLLNDEIINNFTRSQAEFESERLYKESILLKNAQIDKITLKKQSTFIVLFIGIIIILIVFTVLFIIQNKQRGKLLSQLSDNQIELQLTNNELEKSNKTKDKFFTMLAHDLKSPFNSILGFSQLLKANVEKGDNVRNLEFTNHIHSSADKTLKLLDNLLQWFGSRIGRVGFKPDSVELIDIINKNIELFFEVSVKKKITLSSTVKNNIYVYADINLLNTVLRNLISNAIKFTHPNGTICINAIENDNEIEISVVDNGIGIKKDIIPILFNIDSKITTQGTEGETGTGFGLALVKEFVEKNNGRVWLESEPGNGSKFFFTIPASKM